MSKKSLFGVISALFLLASCGGGKTSEPATSSKEEPASSQAAPTSSEAPAPTSSEAPAPASSEAPAPSSSEAPASSSSEAPAPTMVKASADLLVEGGKAYAVVRGTASNYPAGSLKFAWGFEHVTKVDQGEGFAYGSSEPADADYKEVVTVAADGTYEAKFCLTDAGIENGLYKVYAGAKGFYGTIAAANSTIAETIIKDNSYQYNYRKDEECDLMAAIAIDLLPPIKLTEADIYTEADGKTWVKVGGELRERYKDLTAPDASWTPFVQFQQVGGRWTITKVTGEDNVKWDFSEPGKAYLCANVDFFAVNTNYNTHINMTENRQQDCKMEVDINKTVTSKGKKIQIYSNTQASTSDQNEFWGNLGFKVTRDNGITATFACDEHSTVSVYNSQDYTVEPTALTNGTAVTKDGTWGTPTSDGTGQINFKVNCAEGYVVDTITATPGTYKNIKLIDSVNNIYRVTQVTAETTIEVKTIAASEVVEEGYSITFVHDDKVTVKVGKSQDEAIEGYGEVTDSALSRESKFGKATKTDGQCNFRVSVAEGYKVDLANITITCADGKGYKNFTQDPDGEGLMDYFKITKISGNITVTITAVAA